jgi:hypothetical protein
VYTGVEIDEQLFPDHKIIVQRSNLLKYNDLDKKNLNIDSIKKLAWVVPKDCIVKEEMIEWQRHSNSSKDDLSWDMSYDRSVMFIFGAGASAHCVYDEPSSKFKGEVNRPPLGTELFDERFEEVYTKYPGVSEALYFLQGNGIDVEGSLEDEWAEVTAYNNAAIISRHINIQYYVQEILKNASLSIYNSYSAKNLFAVLTDKLSKACNRNKKKKFAFVSFNQDNILELFVGKYFRHHIKSMDDYADINRLPFCIFKPHGSWNWGWKFPSLDPRNRTTSRWLFEDGLNYCQIFYELLGDYSEMIDWQGWGWEAKLNSNGLGKFGVNKSKLSLIDNGNENLYFPGLLLPYRDKDEFTMPNEHFETMFHYISNVKTIIIIGWKGNEKLFNQILKEQAIKLEKVVIVDPDPQTVENNLSFLFSQGGIEKKNYSDFEQFVLHGIVDEIN